MVRWKIFRESAIEILGEDLVSLVERSFKNSGKEIDPSKVGDILYKHEKIDESEKDLLNEAYELLKIEEEARTIQGDSKEPEDAITFADDEEKPAQERPGLPKLKKFTLVDIIGQGGMGRVYKGVDPDLGRPVAVKEILGKAEDYQKQRFQREILLTAKLDQEHRVIRARAVDQDSTGNTYFVMDFVEGKELTEYVENIGRGRTYSLENTLELLAEALDAMSAAHKKSIIHRDIKPDNIMVDRKNVKIMDWGLAKEIDQEEIEADKESLESTNISRTATYPNLTQDGTVMGTPTYMSPEQAMNAKYADERSDIYSFGAILYEILTGESPNKTNIKKKRKEELDVHTILVNLINLDKPAIPPSKLNKNVPPELESICMNALEKDIEKRYQTAQEFRDDLRAYLKRDDVTAHKYSIFSKISRFVQKHTAAAVSAFLLVSALGLGGVVYQGLQAGKARAEARAEKEAKEKLRLETDLAQEIAEKERQKRKKALTEKLLAEEKAEREKERADKEAIIANKNKELAEKYLATKAVNKAGIFLDQGNIEAAIALLEKWKERVDLAVIHSDLGTIYSRQNRLELAEQEYLRAVELDPEFATIYINLSTLAKKREKYDRAIEYITKAIDINPEYAEAYNGRAALYMHEKKYDKAIEDITRAIALSPENANYVYNKGGTYFVQHKYDLALPEFQKALQLGDTRAYFYIAEIHFERGNLQTAKRFYEECVRSDNSSRRELAIQILENLFKSK